MIDMEEGEVTKLFLGNEEEGVEHVEELGHVEQPGQVQGSDWSMLEESCLLIGCYLMASESWE